MDLLPILALLILAGIIFSSSIFFNPSEAIKIQMKFYTWLNWRIEPLSMQKEIRNTKAMGVFLFVFCVLAILYIKLFLVAGLEWLSLPMSA